MQRGANHERRSKKNPDRRGPGNVPDPRRRDGSDLPGAQKHAVVHGAARAKSRNADPARARTPGRHQSRPGAGNRQDKRSDLEAQAIERALGDLWLIGWKEIRNHWNREISNSNNGRRKSQWFNDDREPETEEEIVNFYSDMDFLIIDDLGAEKSTEFSITTLYIILDRRIRELKTTIITTNLSMSQIEEHLGARIASRLSEMKNIKINMPDHRKRR